MVEDVVKAYPLLLVVFEEAPLFLQEQSVAVSIVFGEVEIGAAALRAIDDAPHGFLKTARRLRVVFLRYGFQQIPHEPIIGRPGVGGEGIKANMGLLRADALLFAMGKIVIGYHLGLIIF